MTEEQTRASLGIVYCPTCKQDTMPCERSGICFFCDRQLVAMKPRLAAA